MNRVLVVDDEREARENTRKALGKRGYYTYEAADGRQALETVEASDIEVVLMDIRMPGMDGMEALGRIKEKKPDTEVIMVSAVSDLDTAIECMKTGAYGYIIKPVNFENMIIEIEKALERRRLYLENRDYQANLEEKVRERTAQVQKLYGLLEANFFKSIRVFVELIELRDPFLGGHARRVAWLSVETGKKFGLDKEKLKNLEIAGLLHDIGSLGMPDRALSAPMEELSDAEKDLLLKRTILAQEILKPIDELAAAGVIIRSHSERVDGGGYPDGLSGADIPLESRILAAVNAYDEVKSRRPYIAPSLYQGRGEEEAAIFYIHDLAGKKFDAKVVEKMEGVLDDLRRKKEGVAPVSINDIREGMTLAEDLVTGDGKLLLAKDNRLSAAHVAKIRYYHKVISPITRRIYIYRPQGRDKQG